MSASSELSCSIDGVRARSNGHGPLGPHPIHTPKPGPQPGIAGEQRPAPRPTEQQAADAIRTLLAYAGEDPDREGLLETPDRVLRAYGEFFAGYDQDPATILAKSFREVNGYNGPVVVRDIAVHSHCEHHMVPFTGHAHIAYLPDQRVVGLSKIARLVDVFARRLQIQERLTAQIANALQDFVQPHGVIVVIEAEHHCMSSRGVLMAGATTATTMVTGIYERHAQARAEVLRDLTGRSTGRSA